MTSCQIEDLYSGSVITTKSSFVRDLLRQPQAHDEGGTGLIRNLVVPWPQFGWNHGDFGDQPAKIFQWSGQIGRLTEAFPAIKSIMQNIGVAGSIFGRNFGHSTDKTLSPGNHAGQAVPRLLRRLFTKNQYWDGREKLYQTDLWLLDFRKRGYCAWCLLGYRHHRSGWLTKSAEIWRWGINFWRPSENSR